ncbi:hypothetical protein KFE94_09775 [bacterium SCSIO 12643]|nr:hypothetical protein KFE94_09775 [bacterium SCSIO 12643]
MKTAQRKGLDQKLTSKNYTFLSGAFDCSHKNLPLISTREEHTKSPYDSVHLQAISRKLILIEKYAHGVCIDTIQIKGKFKNGYFKTKRNWETHYTAGPLLWTLQDHFNYIGLTKDHNLILLHMDGGTVGFFLFFPFMAGNNHQYASEYPQI